MCLPCMSLLGPAESVKKWPKTDRQFKSWHFWPFSPYHTIPNHTSPVSICSMLITPFDLKVLCVLWCVRRKKAGKGEAGEVAVHHFLPTMHCMSTYSLDASHTLKPLKCIFACKCANSKYRTVIHCHYWLVKCHCKSLLDMQHWSMWIIEYDVQHMMHMISYQYAKDFVILLDC